MKIILASKSPRRKELLELMGIQDFEVKVSNVDETLKENLTIQEQIKDLDIDMGDVEISNTRDIGYIINEENGYLTFKIANYNSQTSNNNQIAQIVDYSGIFKPMMIDFIKQFVR